MTDTHVAVVGGGIVGASVAYHLRRLTDRPVAVYDRGALGAETTAASTAMVGPGGPDALAPLAAYGLRLYNDFFADPAAEPRYRRSGRLRVATTPAGARELERAAADEAAPPFRNEPVDYVAGEDLRGRYLLPGLDADRVEGALFRSAYGHVWSEGRTLGAGELAREFAERARDAGATFEPHTPVAALATDGERVTGLEFGSGAVVDADAVVCAAGPWTPALVEGAGLSLPVEHVRSPVFALEPPRPLPAAMPTVKSHESGVGIHPKRDDRLLVTYTPDETGRYDPDAVDGPRDEHRRAALEGAERLWPALADAALVDEWVGVGVATPDGGPLAGPTAVDGLWLALAPSGVRLAPAVGDVLARWLVDGDPTDHRDAVSPARFDGA